MQWSDDDSSRVDNEKEEEEGQQTEENEDEGGTGAVVRCCKASILSLVILLSMNFLLRVCVRCLLRDRRELEGDTTSAGEEEGALDGLEEGTEADTRERYLYA